MTRRSSAAAKPSGGFTLIELLVVIALIGLIVLVALPTVSSMFQVSLGSASRELATTIKEAYNSAMITGKVHRVAYDLKENQYWAESGPSSALLETEASREKQEQRKKFKFFEEEKEKDSSPFSLDKAITRNKKSLPRGVEFEDVMTEKSNEPLRQGIAYTHIFPSGITEKTLIHLKDTQKHQITLVIETITGKTRMLNGYLSEKEISGEAK
ncbi:prepilin-type N-terminal cleavage/methylation domain-containing protein [bacterium]|nr:prepilin-type N-terminal cleavage/methylation domain-containing protein [bacterium]